MTLATLSALLLLIGGFIHSFSFLNRKLPPNRRLHWYPRHPLGSAALNVLWILLFLSGIRLAFTLSFGLGMVATLIYFVALPFVFQPTLARMMGFADLKDHLRNTGEE